jgi:exopolysaccharide biosynthesis polyprenyl glycosylphosphotransferase
MLLVILPLWVALIEHSGLYARLRYSWSFFFWRLLRVQGIGLSVLAAVIFAFKLEDIGRLMVFGFVVLSVPLVLCGRWLVVSALRAHLSHIYSIPRVLVIGTRDRARDFIRRVKRLEDIRYEVIGCLDPELAYGSVEGVPVLGTTAIFRQYVFARPVDVVVFAMPLEKLPNAKCLAEAALELGLRVMVCPDFYFEHLGYSLEDSRVSVESHFGMPMPVFSTVRQEGTYLLWKRALDVTVSVVLLLLLSPLFLIIAIVIRLTSPDGPVFYRWKVVGTNKKPFVSYKFRTMVRNAPELKAQLAAHNEMTGPVFKMRNDPRVTPVGRILRKFSLDELPQLYSVLKGDMSLVGPRPPSQDEADRFEFWQRRKLSVKPGMTCLWQVNGRNEITDFAEWARLDLEYIQNASLWVDFKVLLKTIPAVLRGRGAY